VEVKFSEGISEMLSRCRRFSFSMMSKISLSLSRSDVAMRGWADREAKPR
jgi:hypothetical protein